MMSIVRLLRSQFPFMLGFAQNSLKMEIIIDVRLGLSHSLAHSHSGERDSILLFNDFRHCRPDAVFGSLKILLSRF